MNRIVFSLAILFIGVPLVLYIRDGDKALEEAIDDLYTHPMKALKRALIFTKKVECARCRFNDRKNYIYSGRQMCDDCVDELALGRK